MYFGPDGNIEPVDGLYNKETNKGKNNKLVSFIDTLSELVKDYHKNQSVIEECNKNIRECNGCYTEDEVSGDLVRTDIKCWINEFELFTEEDCEESKSVNEDKLASYKQRQQKIHKELNNLSEIMRIYGKIEWNRAKEGK